MEPLLSCGRTAPSFSLPDLSGNLHHLADFQGLITVLNFWSAECPWVERSDRELKAYLPVWGEAVAVITIAPNAHEPIELLRRVALERTIPLLLHDQTQRVADLYGALTTPHVYVIDRIGILRYQGSINDLTFRKRTSTRHYLYEAIKALLAGRQPDPEQTPPYGCSIVRFA